MIDAEERKYSNVTVFDISNILNVVRGNMACLALDLEFATLYAFKRDKPLYSFEDEDGLYFFSTERIGRKVFGNQPFKEFKENEIQCYA
jgi:hypothetical protein